MDKPMNVLFLDDEDNMLLAIERLFMTEPFGILTTVDPDKALELIGQHPIKVVLSDQMMLKITGIKFLQRVKEAYPDKIRIIMSGSDEFVSAEEAVNQGEVFRFIKKPWDTSFLKSSINQAIALYDSVETRRQLFAVEKEFKPPLSPELHTSLNSITMALERLVVESASMLDEDQKKLLSSAKDNIERLNSQKLG